MNEKERIANFLHDLSKLTHQHKIYIDTWMHGISDHSLVSLYDKDGLIATNVQIKENGRYYADING